MPKKTSNTSRTARDRISQIQERIAALDHVCSGTLYERTKVCGNPGCRCANDPSARHGPYHVWSRREGGRLVQSNVSADQAKSFARANRNWRRVQTLLKRWERESARAIRERPDPSS